MAEDSLVSVNPERKHIRHVTIGGKTYKVNLNTGVVRDENGVIIADAIFDTKTGSLTIDGRTIDVTPKGSPVAGQTYTRDFTDTKKFSQVSYQGTTYYVNKKTGNAFTTSGVFTGTYKDGKFNVLFEGDQGETETPDEGDEEGTDRPTPEEQKYQNDLFAEYRRVLEEFGLTGMDEFLKRAVAEDWSTSQFMLELRRSEGYLANPLFAANMQRAQAGGGFMAEAQVIAYANETKRLAQQYGYTIPSDVYIAQNLASGRSLAEFEHRVQITRNVENFGPAVRLVMEQELGIVLGDDDLFELFDPEKDTQEWTDAYKNALYRGRPFVLGLGIRSETEAAALRLLGVDPEEAFSRYQGVAQNAPRFDRLTAIEGLITDKLPADFGKEFGAMDNSLLVRGLVFQDPQTMAQLQQMASREIARWNTGGGVASAQGQALGLLTAAERGTVG